MCAGGYRTILSMGLARSFVGFGWHLQGSSLDYWAACKTVRPRPDQAYRHPRSLDSRASTRHREHDQRIVRCPALSYSRGSVGTPRRLPRCPWSSDSIASRQAVDGPPAAALRASASSALASSSAAAALAGGAAEATAQIAATAAALAARDAIDTVWRPGLSGGGRDGRSCGGGFEGGGKGGEIGGGDGEGGGGLGGRNGVGGVGAGGDDGGGGRGFGGNGTIVFNRLGRRSTYPVGRIASPPLDRKR